MTDPVAKVEQAVHRLQALTIIVLAFVVVVSLISAGASIAVALGNRQIVEENDRSTCLRLQEALSQIPILSPPVVLDCPKR